MIEENTDFLDTEEERKEHEIWFREHVNDFPPYWDAIDLRHFDPNFFREFKHKFHWHSNEKFILTRPATFVRKRYGDKFFKEMTGYKVIGDY